MFSLFAPRCLPLAAAALLALVLLAPVVAAQDLDDACAGAFSTAQMIDCAGDVLRRVEADMTAAYATLAERLPPDRLPALEATQSAWEDYADASAQFAASAVVGGTMAPLLRLADRIERTNARLNWLQEMNE